MRRVFADTYFLLALLNDRDADHERAGEWWERLCDDEIITTAWVLVEQADGMSRGQSRKVCAQRRRSRSSNRLQHYSGVVSIFTGSARARSGH